MRMTKSLAFRTFTGSCLLLIALIALYAYLGVRLQTEQMTSQVNDSAGRVSDIIKNSTRYSMLHNRREDVYQIITTIGREPGVEGIRIYNKRGAISYSTDPSEQDRIVDMKAEACYACHVADVPLQALPAAGRSRIYMGARGHRVIGLINPIRNEEACANADCHAHPPEKTVLGVLDVRMSLEKVDANAEDTRRQYILYGMALTFAVALALALFLYLSVYRPVHILMEGTRQIGQGNLEYRVPPYSHEIGQLGRAFNEMAQSLELAHTENRQWSETLERRVEEKSLELRQIHDRILQIEKMASLGKLSATVAHELNNPLEGILTYSKLIARRLRREAELSEPQRKTLEEIELISSEVQRCGNIVKNLLLFSRKQVGEFSLAPVRRIVERSALLVRHHMEMANVAFESDFPSDEASILCDENQIQQALVALMVNAVEAMPRGGSLKIQVSQDGGGTVHIKITDRGIGIAAEDIPHIFEPFFTTKKEGQGVGLGLSVVYGIVERHGGSVSVDSKSGIGTTFTLSFPPAATPHPRVETPEAAALGAAGGADRG